MRCKLVRIVLLGAFTASLVAAPVLAAASDVVRARIEGLRELGALFKNVNDELKSSTPQPMIMRISSRQITDVARDQYKWFPAGSGPEAGVKTKAKPEIWQRAAEFKKAQDNFATQAAAFNKVVLSGDVAKMRTQVRLLGATCSNCHKTFRNESRS